MGKVGGATLAAAPLRSGDGGMGADTLSLHTLPRRRRLPPGRTRAAVTRRGTAWGKGGQRGRPHSGEAATARPPGTSASPSRPGDRRLRLLPGKTNMYTTLGPRSRAGAGGPLIPPQWRQRLRAAQAQPGPAKGHFVRLPPPPRGGSDLFSLPGVGPKTRRKWGRWPTSPARRAWAGLPQVHLSPGRTLASTACRDLEGRRRPPAAWPEAEVRQRTCTRHSRPDGHMLRQRLTHPSRPFAPQPQGRAAPSPLHPAGDRAPGTPARSRGQGGASGAGCSETVHCTAILRGVHTRHLSENPEMTSSKVICKRHFIRNLSELPL